MAIVAPLLFLLTLGAIEYGWMFLKAQQITNAARQGARVGATPDATAGDVNAAVNSVMTAADITGHTVTISPGVSIASGETLTVTVSVPYAGISLLSTPLIPTPANLAASTAMAKEGP
jgi:Flp pilus assembly protein TadG